MKQEEISELTVRKDMTEKKLSTTTKDCELQKEKLNVSVP